MRNFNKKEFDKVENIVNIVIINFKEDYNNRKIT